MRSEDYTAKIRGMFGQVLIAEIAAGAELAYSDIQHGEDSVENLVRLLANDVEALEDELTCEDTSSSYVRVFVMNVIGSAVALLAELDSEEES